MKIVPVCYKCISVLFRKGVLGSFTFCFSVRRWRVRPELVRLLVGHRGQVGDSMV